MTPERMAVLHRAAFLSERPWSATEFRDLLTNKFVQSYHDVNGFALARTVAGESELLTLAVDPLSQRQGIGRLLTLAWLDSITDNTESAFLEVAADNDAARALYASLGFTEVARRSAYYARKNATAADAIVMRRDLT
jgi:ribosomal-protein-alanine N-acetyltransferase